MTMIPEQFEQLISRYLDGTIDTLELQELDAALVASDDFCRHAAEWCLAHGQIVDVLREDQFHDLIDQMLVSRPGPPNLSNDRKKNQAIPAGLFPGATRWRGAAAGGLLVAATLFLGLIFFPRGHGASLTEQSSEVPGLKATSQPEPSKPVAIAALTQLIDASWKPDAAHYATGQILEAGARVALAEGRAKVTFDCGAEVVLEGPCDLELRGAMVAVLHEGRLTADVPRRAFGFGVLCPGVDLVDLGTSFGVSVGDNCQTELHVFKGEVLCSPNKLDRQGDRQLVHVHENEAKSFRKGSSSTADIEMDRGQFETLFSVRRSKGATPRLAVDEHLALWLAADGDLTVDAEQRVINCCDILQGGNTSAEDALQPAPDARPLLVADGMNGKPTIRFDGESDFLLTTPLETTDDQTVLLVCQFGATAMNPDRAWGGQILNYDGPPSRYLSDTLEPGVLQIGEPLLESQFKPTLLSGQVFAGFVGETTVEAGRVDANPIGVGKPALVAYTYDYSQGRSELRINGRLCGSSRAFAPQGITSRKIIGRHAWMQLFFCGDLSEMLIYNAALTPDELEQTSAYLAAKYALTLESTHVD